jgi:hypothetical protein
MQPMVVVVERAEQIKWWDVQDKVECHPALAVQMARECLHPDAIWLALLFPEEGPGGEMVTEETLLSAMEAQGDDPRALFLRSKVSPDERVLLQRASDLGYAPAQAALCSFLGANKEAFTLAEKSAASGDRRGMYHLGRLLLGGGGCAPDPVRAASVWREAAELGQAKSQSCFGQLAFPAGDWQRYRWMGRGAVSGYTDVVHFLIEAADEMLYRFKEGSASGRVVFELGSVFKELMDIEEETFDSYEEDEIEGPLSCVQLHDEWCDAAKAAIECWLLVGKRRCVRTDIRLTIARLLWVERAHWSIAKLAGKIE